MSDSVLSYLQGDSTGAKRDMIALCYYELAQGDPKSGPVRFAVLLTACAEQVARLPGELHQTNGEFKKLLAEGREMEARIRERVELSNAGVVADFKDETRRANSALRETFQYAKEAGECAKDTTKESRAILVEMRMLANDLTRLRQDLKIRDDSHEKIVESVQNIETACEGTHDTVQHLTRECRANWITTGLLVGMFLSALFSQLPWWGALLAFAGIIGLLQWLSRQSWDFVRRWIESWKSSSVKSKPIG